MMGSQRSPSVLLSQPRYSLLRLTPVIGARKHQLRVHTADVLRAPIVGDFKLAPETAHGAALDEVGLPHDSVLLHAHGISFWVRLGSIFRTP